MRRSRATKPRARTRLLGGLGLALVALGAAGCASIGPATVPRDRTDYITAVAESWKEQTLLNVVRIRYGDAPSFVDVSSVINSYSVAGQVAATGQVPPNPAPPFPLAILGGNAAYVDRPTITYTPVTGDKFARSLLKPIPPSAIFELIQAGYPADAILQLTARGINGLYGRSSQGGEVREADPEFYAVLDALRRLQLSGAVALRIEKHGADEVGILLFAHTRSAAADADYQFVMKALRVNPGQGGEMTLTFGAQPRNDQEIAVLSRSMLAILTEVANGIDVPSAHVAEGRAAAATRTADAADPHDRPLVRVLSGREPPADAYAAVRYRGAWYWIADDDLPSKRVFSFLMMFFSLAETGVAAQPPVVTIPAG
ncbi:MAG TPA: hypothetical protein VMT68_02710 [Caulobacteraceae bacterium]|nr:hypothetical protein [Caulobacteraceae bacterium]